VNRPTPDRPDEDDVQDEDEEVLSRLVLEAGDPTVELRAVYVAELGARFLDRLGPPRADRLSSPLRLVVSGLAAACLVAVLTWPRGDGDLRPAGSGSSGRHSPDPIAPRPRQDFAGIAAWGNVRRGLDLSEMPGFSWPLQESSRLSVLTSIPPDLLD
jgi:hypothetical protein